MEQNLEATDDRLGKLELVDAVDGRIKVAMDSTKPLKFKRKLQTKKKEDITIKLFYEKLFKHCSTCGLMTHENQDCLQKQPVLNQMVFPERMCLIEFGHQDKTGLLVGMMNVVKMRLLISLSKMVRALLRSKAADKGRGPVWKEKLYPLRIEEPVNKRSDMDIAHTSGSLEKAVANRGKNAVEPLADDLIPPYDALKIDALNEHEQDEEDQAVDAEMQDAPLGNELMVMEEDGLLEEDLNQIESQERVEQERIEPDSSILVIEAKDKATVDDNGEDYAKALTRTDTHSLFTSSQATSQRRASLRINAKPLSGQGSGLQESTISVEKRKGLKFCETGRRS
ncbi:hypothetical protein F2Q69_00013600 [Brassica cretica]|uniref:Zinc knuckle CX2CX4HX4C domain-containing protein n=1 Tax=Brassica cretica TaxID=69181 RepID=A0A8S9QZ24_BRACR|nr:hypothetical protein F2Q69_00013600 [Brassica cretica]